MKWITRKGVKVDRVACPWLIRKFVDSDAEFLFVPKDSISPQEATHAVFQAVALLTRAGLPLPASTDGHRDPTW